MCKNSVLSFKWFAEVDTCVLLRCVGISVEKVDGDDEHDCTHNVHKVGRQYTASLTGKVEEDAIGFRDGEFQTSEKRIIYIIFQLIWSRIEFSSQKKFSNNTTTRLWSGYVYFIETYLVEWPINML